MNKFSIILFSIYSTFIYARTLLIPLEYPVSNFDPISVVDTNGQFILLNAYRGLIGWSYKEGFTPDIADSWTVKGNILKFKLKSDLLFQDEVPLSCELIKAHFQRLASTESRYKEIYQSIEEIACELPNLEFKLKKYSSDFLYTLAGVSGKITKKVNNNISGIGPYKITINEKGIISLHSTNPKINTAYYDTIIMPVISNENLKNEIDTTYKRYDFIIPLHGVNIDQKNFTDSKYIEYPLWETWAIAFDLRVKPFNKFEVRKQLSEKISSEKWVKDNFPENAFISYGFIPMGLPGAINKKIQFKTSKMLKNIKDQLVIYIPQEIGNASKIKKWIESQSKGLNVLVKLHPFSDLILAYGQAKFGAFLLSFNSETPNIHNFLVPLYSKSKSNFIGLNSKKIDFKIDEILSVNEFNKVHKNAEYINKYLMNNHLVIPLMHPKHNIIFSKCISNITYSPISVANVIINKVVNTCN